MAAVSARAAFRRRAPLMALALVALLAGMWGALIRLGLVSSSVAPATSEAHGPLMALGFLGTLVSLERAVALRRPWAYLAPLATGLGALAALAGAPYGSTTALLGLGGLVLLADHLLLARIAPSAHNSIMGLGAAAWVAACVAWLAGADVGRFAYLLAGFLVLTIVGERLELTRVLARPKRVQRVLLGAVVLFACGLALSLFVRAIGVQIAGIGLLAQAGWLARYDIARRTVRLGGVTRFMAVALLAGYLWLSVAGALWLLDAPTVDGPAYDAALHAVFLGFVFSMVFAHAPVIVPAVLRTPMPFDRAFYLPLALLHASLALRLLGGDLAGELALWRWGGVLGGLAILAFLALTATKTIKGRNQHEQDRSGREPRRARRRTTVPSGAVRAPAP